MRRSFASLLRKGSKELSNLRNRRGSLPKGKGTKIQNKRRQQSEVKTFSSDHGTGVGLTFTFNDSGNLNDVDEVQDEIIECSPSPLFLNRKFDNSEGNSSSSDDKISEGGDLGEKSNEA